jgi:hypothetical protein
LKRPNRMIQEAMPLGNGTLGAAVWAEDGFTAHLVAQMCFPCASLWSACSTGLAMACERLLRKAQYVRR